MAPVFFRIMLALVALYVLWRGRRDEREIGFVLVVGVIATHLSISPLSSRYAGVETNVLIVDLLVLASFLYVALKSDRFWPLWIAGLHVTTVVAHALKLLTGDLVPIAYAVALRFWAYPELIILAVAVWRHNKRLSSPPQVPQPT